MQQRDDDDVTRAGEGVQGLHGEGGLAAADEEEAEERQRQHQLVQLERRRLQVQSPRFQQLSVRAPATRPVRSPRHSYQHVALQQQQQEAGKFPNVQH